MQAPSVATYPRSSVWLASRGSRSTAVSPSVNKTVKQSSVRHRLAHGGRDAASTQHKEALLTGPHLDNASKLVKELAGSFTLDVASKVGACLRRVKVICRAVDGLAQLQVGFAIQLCRLTPASHTGSRVSASEVVERTH